MRNTQQFNHSQHSINSHKSNQSHLMHTPTFSKNVMNKTNMSSFSNGGRKSQLS